MSCAHSWALLGTIPGPLVLKLLRGTHEALQAQPVWLVVT